MNALGRIVAITLASSLTINSVSGASNVSVQAKYSWSETTGWLNWRDANGGAQGVFAVPPTGGNPGNLRAYIWSENTGWIHVGAGPGGASYANTNGSNYGVNIDPGTGALSGFGWGENIGWVNFSGGGLASPPNPARLDIAARRFRGFAWSENAGWINLDDLTHYVGLTCGADLDGDGTVGAADLSIVLGAWGPGGGSADLNGDGAVTSSDLALLLGAWGPCP